MATGFLCTQNNRKIATKKTNFKTNVNSWTYAGNFDQIAWKTVGTTLKIGNNTLLV